MVNSQPIEEEVQRIEMRDEGTKIQKGPTGPTLQTQTTPSPSLAFVKENIDILRTMIKEIDHQAKAKTTPRKVIYIDSEKEAPDRSMTKGFSDRFSLESIGTSDTCGETHSAGKGQKGLSKGKELSRLIRSKGGRTEAKLSKEPEGRNPNSEKEDQNTDVCLNTHHFSSIKHTKKDK
ncbi:hypothetical protein Tco_1248965 [Tanacetum coccineum]